MLPELLRRPHDRVVDEIGAAAEPALERASDPLALHAQQRPQPLLGPRPEIAHDLLVVRNSVFDGVLGLLLKLGQNSRWTLPDA